MKKVCFLIFGLLLTQLVFAQGYESVILTNNNAIQEPNVQKIQAYDSTKVVFLSRDDGGNYSFYYFANGTTTARKIEFSNGEKITDFAILEDYVYFSGNDSSPFIGRFEMSAFLSQRPVEYYYLSQAVQWVSQIVAYKGPSDDTLHVVGLAQDQYNNSVLFELRGYDHNDYNNWRVNYSTNIPETLRDIDFDDKYLVTVGTNGGNTITLRQFYRDTPVTQTGATNAPVTGYNYGNYIHLQHIDNYRYAVVSNIIYSTIYNSQATRIQMFDMQGTPQLLYESDRTIYPDNNVPCMIRETEYSDTDNSLMILMQAKEAGNADEKDFVVYVPLGVAPPTATSVTAIYFYNYYPNYPTINDICMYKPLHYMLIGVEPNNSNIFLFSKDKTFNYAASCNNYSTIKMSGENLNNTIPGPPNPLYNDFQESWITSFESNPVNEVFNVDCSN